MAQAVVHTLTQAPCRVWYAYWYMDLEKRKAGMISLRKQGLTLKEIGLKYSVSRERVRQIIHNLRPRQPKIVLWRRITCLVCRQKLESTQTKYCIACVSYYQLDRQGREKSRSLVRARDNDTCQSCGQVGGGKSKRLDVHHQNGNCGKMTKSYDKVSALHDLITVCHKCHYNLHDHRQNGTHTL